MKFNKNNQGKGADENTTTKENKGKDAGKQQMSSHEEVSLSKDVIQAIKWLGNQFGTLRPWIGDDQRDYCTVTPKASAKPPKPYESVGDVALAIIDNLKEVGAEEGVAVFASYSLNYKGNRAVGRLISVTKEGKLVFALEVEYSVTSNRSGIQTMVPKGDRNTEESKEDDDNDAGFGKF